MMCILAAQEGFASFHARAAWLACRHTVSNTTVRCGSTK
jgi:hypothetical protein